MFKEDKSYFASVHDIVWTETTKYDQLGSKVESSAAIAEGFKGFFYVSCQMEATLFLGHFSQIEGCVEREGYIGYKNVVFNWKRNE